MISISKYLTNKDPKEDATPALRAALEDCLKTGAKELFFPKGTYYFHPEDAKREYCFISNNDEGVKHIAFYLNGIEDFTINGDHSTFIFHGRMVPFIMKNCRNLRLRNFSIDFDRSFITRGVVVETRENQMDVRFSPEEVYFVENGRIYFFEDEYKFARPFINCMEYDVEGMEVLHDTVDSYFPNDVVEIAPGFIRFSGISNLPRKGNTVLLKHELRLNPGIVIDRSENVNIEEVVVHHAGGMGIIAQNSADLTLKKVVVGVPEDTDRLISTTDDATHFSNCRGSINITDCVFENQWDDGVNIHGIYRRFRKRNVGALDFYFLEAAQHQQMGVEVVEPGEVLEFINTNTLLPYHSAKVKSVQSLNKQITKVEFEEPLPSTVNDGDCVTNLAASPKVLIRDCVIGNSKPRGVLVTTKGDVLIEKNRFHTSGAAIYISGDANFWFESSGVENVTIIDNIFDNCNYMKNATGTAVIDICPEIADEFLDAGYYHDNIRILDNTFNVFDTPLVNAKSVKLLEFKGNAINKSTAYPEYSNIDIPINCHQCEKVITDSIIDV